MRSEYENRNGNAICPSTDNQSNNNNNESNGNYNAFDNPLHIDNSRLGIYCTLRSKLSSASSDRMSNANINQENYMADVSKHNEKRMKNNLKESGTAFQTDVQHDVDLNDVISNGQEHLPSTSLLKNDSTIKHASLPYPLLQESSSSSDEQSSKRPLDLLSYCTMSKRLKQMISLHHNESTTNLPYRKLEESRGDLFDLTNQSSITSPNNYGLSNNLSTESIKMACDCYDLSDDENNKNSLSGSQRPKSNPVSLTSNLNNNYRSRPQQNSQAMNNYLLEKLENRLTDLKKYQEINASSSHSKLENLKLSQTLDRKMTSHQSKLNSEQKFYPYCTMKREKITNNIVTGNEVNTNINAGHNTTTPDGIEISTFYGKTNDCSSLTHQSSLSEAYNILSELDEILANTESISSSEELSKSLDFDNHQSNSQSYRNSPIQSEATTEKIEDCLCELDEYLDEIDRETPKLYRDSEDDYYSDDYCINENFKRSKTLPKKLKLMLNENRLDNRTDLDNRNVITNQLSQFATIDRGTEILQRGHILRNTIAGLRHKIVQAKLKQTNNDDGQTILNDQVKDKLSSLTPRKTWRRNSMRKTALLILPEHEQNVNRNSINQSEYLDSQQITQNSSNAMDHLRNQPHHSSQEPSSNNASPNHNNSLPPNVNTEVRRCLSQSDCTQLESLANLDIVDILNNTTLQNDEFTNQIDETPTNRPRQVGRRAEAHPRILSITTETTNNGHRIIVNHDRPMSAPAATSARRTSHSTLSPLAGVSNTECQRRYIGSEASSIGSSRNPSPVSLISSTGSSSLGSTSPDNVDTHPTVVTATTTSATARSSQLDPDNDHSSGMNSYWPHGFSRILALLCCTLGLFNISRFATLTVHYGGNFLIQFLILSIIFGIPMLWLQMCLGSKIKSGPVSMWKISPICRGVGISLCLAQCVIALYSTISLAWILVYFRDSFVRKTDFYRWQEPFYIYRRQSNFTGNLTENVADYFNGIVLQRWQLGLGRRIETGGVRFQLAFNLAIIWAFVFIILCKGLKSFGKIVLGLTVIPLVLFFVVTCQLLYIIDFSSVQNIFSASDFEDFLINSKTWIAAAQETFLTWTLLGPSVISITSRSTEKHNTKTVLRRDAIVVVLLTIFGLSLAAVFGYACVQILQNYDYVYLPGSYENTDSYIFLYSLKNQLSPSLVSIPTKWIPHYSSVLGETYRRQSSLQFRESGYEPLRLITELFPAVVAVAQDQISSVFTVFGFLAFVGFGLAQLCAMWKPISSALGNSSSSVLLSCVTGLLLGIPFATEMGLSIIHYMDIVIGGAWWILILWAAQILGIFLIRGRPYNGDLLVNDLKMAGSMSAFLALSWNVLLPIGLISLAIMQYKISGSNQFYYWRGKSYFNFWTRKVGGLIQVGFLLIVPLTAIVQIYRYLSTGPVDILDRIQNLYRPTQSPLPHRRGNRAPISRPTSGQANSSGGNNAANNLEAQNIQDDAPPKYTPPPSYTTATGARLAKMLRQSIRRSVRRILGEPSRTRPTLHTSTNDDSSLPPEYSTVLSDPSGVIQNDENIEIGPRVLYNSNTNRTLSLERQRRVTDTNIEIVNRPSSAALTRNTNNCEPISTRSIIPFSASDVAQILRTNRHERSVSALATRVDHGLRTSSLRCKSSRSVENLVLNAAPLGESSAIALSRNSGDDGSGSNESTSVI